MIAVFCKYGEDFDKEISFSPKKMFKKIRTGTDLIGEHFDGIILFKHDWYLAEDAMLDAYYLLNIRQPELFK